jgi:nitroimidazol reductase NimA-like FMN-containing flavoprotein (pyridoxamine 5'-phosphate oxidase superfamily)
MVDVRGAWSSAQLEAFLDEATVPFRLAARTPSDFPWIVPLWYVYRDGAFHCATGRSADIVGFLDRDDRLGFDVSTNDPPYRGVRGSGEATIEPDPEKELLREVLNRYLGGTESSLADRLLAADREEVRIEIDPSKLVTWDYSDRMADV